MKKKSIRNFLLVVMVSLAVESINARQKVQFKKTESNEELDINIKIKTQKKSEKVEFSRADKKAKRQEKIEKRHQERLAEHDSDPLYSNFDNGMVLIVLANFSGSLTDPYISKSDLAKMGANTFKGGVGFNMSGEFELGYVFGKKRWFPQNKNRNLSGVGLFFVLGVGQGSASQASGSFQGGKQVNVFFSAKYMPVLQFGATTKVYFFHNRMALGSFVGAKMIADAKPEYYFYSDDPDLFATEVGTLIITKDMMKRMNPVMFSVKAFLEYNQPILRTLQMVLRFYGEYNVFKPKYITMPPKLEKAAKVNVGFDPSQPIQSLYLNSFDFGISVGLSFKG